MPKVVSNKLILKNAKNVIQVTNLIIIFVHLRSPDFHRIQSIWISGQETMIKM